MLEAWLLESREGEELVVAGLDERAGAEWLGRATAAARAALAGRREPAATRPRGRAAARCAGPPALGRGTVRFAGLVPRDEYRALLRRSRAFLSAPRREDYGIAQLEALADGCVLVTTPAPGPYVAAPIARRIDNRLVGPRLAIRAALDAPRARLRRARGRGARAVLARRGRRVWLRQLPRLLGSRGGGVESRRTRPT